MRKGFGPGTLLLFLDVSFIVSQPSKTCLYVAAGRALGAREPDESIRNPDYLAERLLGPAERAMVADQAVVQALELDFAEARKNIEALSSAIMMIIRTRFIEERLAQAIRDGVSQVVILGAGFDTRAYRLTELLRAARLFEVDQSPTQEYKKRRIKETGIEVPPNLRYVPVDFRHDKLGDVLAKAGYDSTQKTFFIWEGVTMYLPEEAVEETLRWVAAQATSKSTLRPPRPDLAVAFVGVQQDPIHVKEEGPHGRKLRVEYGR